MTKTELFSNLKASILAALAERGLEPAKVDVVTAGLTIDEAIGDTIRKDYPILEGKEIMLEATCMGEKGQAFTSYPLDYKGTLADILDMDIPADEGATALFVAALNAVMRSLGLCDRTVHCKNEEPEQCAKEYAKLISRDYAGKKIAVIGYQPAIIENVSKVADIRVLDLNPENVGHERYGVMIEHGVDDYEAVTSWADLILCTGSTLANGTIVDYLDIGKEVIFFGTTCAGAAPLLGLRRECFESK